MSLRHSVVQKSESDPFEVSTAHYVLDYLIPQWLK